MLNVNMSVLISKFSNGKNSFLLPAGIITKHIIGFYITMVVFQHGVVHCNIFSKYKYFFTVCIVCRQAFLLYKV